MGKGKRVDIYLKEGRGGGIYFLNETSACGLDVFLLNILWKSVMFILVVILYMYLSQL